MTFIRYFCLSLFVCLLVGGGFSSAYAQPADPSSGDGLKGDYYTWAAFQNLMLTRVDPTVNFNWGNGGPDSVVGADQFSVRWTGQIAPRYSETYTFYLTGDDGIRLWVNGTLVIDKWIVQAPTTWSGTITLQADQFYDIKIEYYESWGGAAVILEWASASQAREIIPQARLFSSALPAAPVLNSPSAGDGQVDLSWNAITGATGYKVYYGTASGVYGTPVDVGNVTDYIVSNLTNGTAYYFAVTAYNANGESGYSNEVSATPQVSVATPVLYVSNVDYNAAGQITKIEYGNGVVTEYTYNSLTLRLERIYTVNDQAEVLQDLNYTYDSAGNIISIIDNVNTADQSFEYDELGRLVSATGAAYGTKTYSYDEVGNITQKEGVSYTYGENSAGPHAVTSLSDGTVMTYDANGNMATMTENDIVTAYTYDVENRLVEVTKDGQPLADYNYDGDGGRTSKTVYGSSTVSTQFVGSLYEESGSTATTHIFLGDMRVASISGGTLKYFLADHLGGTNVLTDDVGEKTELIEYKPFGEFARHEMYGSGEDVAYFYFTGKRLDDETGLFYYGARYYNPKLGRFITPDSIVPRPGNPQEFNRYSYVLNNPVNSIDPTGHWSWKKFWKSAVAAVVSAVVFVASGGTATPVIAGFWAGAAGGAVSGALSGGGWQGVLKGAAFGAVTGAAFGGIGAWGADQFGSGFGWGMLGAGGAYAGATGNLDSFAGGLTGAYIGFSLASGYFDAKYGSLSETGPDQGIRAGFSAEDNENWAFLGVGTSEGKAQSFANENQMSVIYHKSKGILSDLFRAGFKRTGVSGPWAKQGANYLNVAEGKFILAHSEGTLNLGGGIKLAAANGVKFTNTSIKWIGPVMPRSTATSLSNSIGAQSKYILNAGDPIGVFSAFNPVQSAIYGGVGLATMTRYHSTNAYVH